MQWNWNKGQEQDNQRHQWISEGCQIQTAVIYFMAATEFCTGGWNIFSHLLNVHAFTEVRQTKAHIDK